MRGASQTGGRPAYNTFTMPAKNYWKIKTGSSLSARPANQPTVVCTPFSDEEELEESPGTAYNLNDTQVRRASAQETYLVRIVDLAENADFVRCAE